MGTNDKQMEIFAKNFRYYMEKTELARQTYQMLLEFHQQLISMWLNGRRLPLIGNVQKIADYFNVTITDLIEEHDDRAQEARLLVTE